MGARPARELRSRKWDQTILVGGGTVARSGLSVLHVNTHTHSQDSLMVGERACWLTHVYDPKATATGEHVPGRKHFESPTSRSPADVEGSDGLPPGFIPP